MVKNKFSLDKIREGKLTKEKFWERIRISFEKAELRKMTYREEMLLKLDMLLRVKDPTDLVLILRYWKVEHLFYLNTFKLPKGFRRLLQLVTIIKAIKRSWEKGEEIVKIATGELIFDASS